MSFFTSTVCSTTRCMSRLGAQSYRPRLILPNQHATSILHARLKSGPACPRPSKAAKLARKPSTPNNSTMRRESSPKIGSAKKSSLILKSLSSSGQLPAVKSAVKVAKEASSASHVFKNHFNPRDFVKNMKTREKGTNVTSVQSFADAMNLELDRKALAIQTRRVHMRKVLWPGIWTLFALAGTYGTFAYLDVKAGVPSSDGSHLPERAQLPQTWYLTPTVIRQGIKAGWEELDNLTVGIVVATVAIHFLRRSPLPIWEKLIHVSGETKWTAFTYPFVNSSWFQVALNMTALVWFLPSVARYFDGDLFHTSAFLISVPLITSYLAHFAFRFNLVRSAGPSLGANGPIAAAFGVYCMAYAKEKVWIPAGLVFRFDAREWGLAFALLQAYNLTQISKIFNRPVYVAHLVGFVLGLAYAYFDVKHHLWIPLVSEISSTQNSDTETEE